MENRVSHILCTQDLHAFKRTGDCQLTTKKGNMGCRLPTIEKS